MNYFPYSCHSDLFFFRSNIYSSSTPFPLDHHFHLLTFLIPLPCFAQYHYQLIPTISAGFTYDDNIFLTPTNEEDDYITLITPGIEFDILPLVSDQELETRQSTDITYWEGLVGGSGLSQGKAVTVEGYVELTGYAGSLAEVF